MQLCLLTISSVSRSVRMTGARIEFIVCIVAVISELLKNVLISEKKGLVLYIDMALSTFLGGT